MLIACLKRVDDAKDFSGIAASAGWVGEDGTDGLLWIDDEDAANGEGDALLVDICGVLVVDPEIPPRQSMSRWGEARRGIDLHVVHERDLPLLVANDWEP